MYADDTQIYTSFTFENVCQTKIKIENCLSEINNWMCQNYLKINQNKTKVIVFHPTTKVSIALVDFINIKFESEMLGECNGMCWPCKSRKCPQQSHKSAIGQHFLNNNAQCAFQYNNENFSILARGCSSFHLFALEATFIKSLNAFLCKQKEFVYSLKIS